MNTHIVSQFTLQFDNALDQFVLELKVGAKRCVTPMGRYVPTTQQLNETEKRMLASFGKPRPSNFVSATEGI